MGGRWWKISPRQTIWQYQNNIQKSKKQISLLEWWTASDQKSQLSKRHGFGWLGSWIPLRPKVGIFLPIPFPGCTSCATLVTPARPPIWGSAVLGFREFPTTGDRLFTGVGFWIPTSWKHIETIYIQIISYWSATGYYSTRISKTCSEICIELIWVQNSFPSAQKNKNWVFSLQPNFISYHIIYS